MQWWGWREGEGLAAPLSQSRGDEEELPVKRRCIHFAPATKPFTVSFSGHCVKIQIPRAYHRPVESECLGNKAWNLCFKMHLSLR